MSHATLQFGSLLKEWRARRRVSQLDLACQGEISTRHLSFLETGRAQPSRDMVLHLAEQLEVPLRDRNTLLTAAGYAPVYQERPLGDPGLRPARSPVISAPAGTFTMTAEIWGRKAAVTRLCWPPILVPMRTSVWPSQSGRLQM